MRIENRKSKIENALLALCFCVFVAIPAHAVKPIQIITKSLAQGQTTVAYSDNVRVKFGVKPYAWSVLSGALPNGLSLNATTGVISGTPTVAATFNFVVRVTGSTTDDQSFYIIIAASAPPPTPAVTIDTTSLPDGIVNGAYSTALLASGGTAPYTWSITAGALPPAAALTAATGAIAGTLSASGTYSLTARVTDSSPTPQTFDRAFAVSVAQAVAATDLFHDYFESNNFAAWDYVISSSNFNASVQSVVKHGGTYAAKLHYEACGDSTNPACGSSTTSVDGYLVKYTNATNGFSVPQNHLYTRAYFRYHENTAAASNLGRKLYFVQAQNLNDWHFSFAVDQSTQKLRVASGPATNCGVAGWAQGGTTVLSADTWYSIEMEFNFLGPGSDVFRAWIDGVLEIERTNLDIRGTCQSTPLYAIRVGEQATRINYQVFNEDRYLDDVVMRAIGPIGP